MNENLNFVHAGLLAEQLKQVVAYNRHLPDFPFCSHKTPSAKVSYANRAHLREPARMLALVVPLLTALTGLRQQPLTLESSGARYYLRRFEALRQQIRMEVIYGMSPAAKHWFDRDIPLLLAEQDVEPSAWKVIRLKDLLETEVQAGAADRLDLARRGLVAEDARKSFLNSLSPAQMQLLSTALGCAKAKGHHAVSFDARDLA